MLSNIIKSNLSISTARCLMTTSSALNKLNVAVLLSGCGVYDGSEITEVSSCAIHLTRHKANVHFFAPDANQMEVVNHLTGEVQVESRNVLVESARIARGKVKPLNTLKGSEFDALVIPGGFGCAKNLSNFATQGTNMSVNKEVEVVLKDFMHGKKPIGLCCIAPILAASVFKNCEITLGRENNDSGQWPYTDATRAAKAIGAVHIPKDIDEIQVDKNLLLVTTPAFMKEAEYCQVYDGIGKMIDEVIKLCN